jgi:hypothetical protein
MTQILESAIAKLATLPEADQERMAKWLLAELASEEGWQQRFEQSGDVLGRMADEALGDLAAGRTTEIDPSKM